MAVVGAIGVVTFGSVAAFIVGVSVIGRAVIIGAGGVGVVVIVSIGVGISVVTITPFYECRVSRYT